MMRGALALLLGMEPDIEVVAQVGTGDTIVEAVLTHRPDVALLDIELPGMSGLDAAAELREQAPGCRVLILTTFGRPGYLRRAMDAGAAGFLVKDGPVEELASAVRRVLAGETVVDPGLAAAALSAGPSPLTARERDVLRASAGGRPSRTWPPGCTCPGPRSATTSPRPSARRAPATARRPSTRPATGVGCDAGPPSACTRRRDPRDHRRGRVRRTRPATSHAQRSRHGPVAACRPSPRCHPRCPARAIPVGRARHGRPPRSSRSASSPRGGRPAHRHRSRPPGATPGRPPPARPPTHDDTDRTGPRGPRSPGAAPEAARAAAVQADGFAVVRGSQAHIRTAPTARTAVPVVKTRA